MAPKILGFKSESYPEGRIDSFRIEEIDGSFELLVSLMRELGAKEKSIRTKIDKSLEDRSNAFLYISPKIKAHLIPDRDGDSFEIRFDTYLDKEELERAIEKRFEYPENN
ncbi:MAG: hypothetical protein ABEJ02_02600 [Candidatus Paceibacteria bacterium]